MAPITDVSIPTMNLPDSTVWNLLTRDGEDQGNFTSLWDSHGKDICDVFRQHLSAGTECPPGLLGAIPDLTNVNIATDKYSLKMLAHRVLGASLATQGWMDTYIYPGGWSEGTRGTEPHKLEEKFVRVLKEDSELNRLRSALSRAHRQ